MKHPKWVEKSRFRNFSSRQTCNLNGDIKWVVPFSDRVRDFNKSVSSYSCSSGGFPQTSTSDDVQHHNLGFGSP